jgi:hypothetical protein
MVSSHDGLLFSKVFVEITVTCWFFTEEAMLLMSSAETLSQESSEGSRTSATKEDFQTASGC